MLNRHVGQPFRADGARVPLSNDPKVNRLYYGDNLQVLRESIASESVDLVYLDPPFNSQRTYNLLFSSPQGQKSDAQIVAFEDSWHWGEQGEREFSEVIHSA